MQVGSTGRRPGIRKNIVLDIPCIGGGGTEKSIGRIGTGCGYPAKIYRVEIGLVCVGRCSRFINSQKRGPGVSTQGYDIINKGIGRKGCHIDPVNTGRCGTCINRQAVDEVAGNSH